MKTIKLTLGTKTNAQYLKAFKKLGSVSAYAEDIIGKVEISKKKQDVKIILLTFEGLGITKSWVTTQEIKDAAIKRGYGIPPAEIALALFQEYMEIGDYWKVLHDSIPDSDGDPRVLCAHRDDGGRWVHTRWGIPGLRWSTYGAFAFLASASQHSEFESLEKTSDSLNLDAAISMVKEAGYTVVKSYEYSRCYF